MRICLRRFWIVSVLLVFAYGSMVQAQPPNGVPDCSQSVAAPAELWPPNHKFQTIAVDQLTDPDGDELTVVIDCIMQDEPLNATGDGNTAIDGRGLGEAQAGVRSERRGNDNGRFYHIGFTATDPAGASCTGAVTVSVAHDKPTPPVDEGPLFQSTETPGADCGAVLGNGDPVITSTPPLLAQALAPYDYPVEASDPDNDPLTFSLLEAPEGMSIESVLGLISWTPTPDQVGDAVVTVEVSDGRGGTAVQTFSISVQPPPNNTPEIISEPVTTVEIGQLYEYPVEAIDPDAGDTLSYELLVAPAGMTIDSQSGLIRWQPGLDQSEDAEVTVRVMDAAGAADQQSFLIDVSTGGDEPPPV